MNLYYLIAFSFLLNSALGFLAAYMANDNADLRIEIKRLRDDCDAWQQRGDHWKAIAMSLKKEQSK